VSGVRLEGAVLYPLSNRLSPMAAHMTQPIIQMQGISKRFLGVQALDTVDFEVYPGEIVGLLGENGAGKSTLIKILSGVYQPDAGMIQMQGHPIQISSPHSAQQLGIATIYQELALVPFLSVAENIFLNREPRRIAAIGMVDFTTMEREAERLLATLGVQIPGGKKVGELTVAAQQMVEIARAISRQASLILMDEPTSALSGRETQALLTLMRRLQASGVAVVFISHRLEEIRQVADRVIVMRDGQRVATLPAAEASDERIIRAMVGREVGLFPKTDVAIGETALEVRGLSGRTGVRDVSFHVRKGEIVGLAGLIGAGRTETVRLICGADPKSAGSILIEGQPVRITTPADAVRYGIGWVPEDRKQQGLVLGMDVKQNTTMAVLRRISTTLGAIDTRQERAITAQYVKRLAIATSSISKVVGELSGGNQQKVVLAKWLVSQPRILILDEPTRGIDIGAKAEVHALMSELAGQGIAILMISSELPEIMGMSDRVIVMCQGRITGEFERHELSQERIMSCATQFLTLDTP
jgi:ABC-type sugar transport system ATPase subunit